MPCHREARLHEEPGLSSRLNGVVFFLFFFFFFFFFFSEYGGTLEHCLFTSKPTLIQASVAGLMHKMTASLRLLPC